jgi:hypothetical protein
MRRVATRFETLPIDKDQWLCIFDQEASTVGVAAKIIWEFACLSGAEAPP